MFLFQLPNQLILQTVMIFKWALIAATIQKSKILLFSWIENALIHYLTSWQIIKKFHFSSLIKDIIVKSQDAA